MSIEEFKQVLPTARVLLTGGDCVEQWGLLLERYDGGLQGRFDIKPLNILYQYFPGQDGGIPHVAVAAADFGFAATLERPTPIRNSCPELEQAPRVRNVDWAAVGIDVSDDEVATTISTVRMTVTKGMSLSEEARIDLVDICFCVSPKGLLALAEQLVYAIAGAVQKYIGSIYTADPHLQVLPEDPPSDVFQPIRDGLQISMSSATVVGRAVDQQVRQIFMVAWATLDRDLRQACRYTADEASNPAVRAAVEALRTGYAPVPHAAKQYYDLVYAKFRDQAEDLEFGLP
ncbi:hypothetical protein BESB_024180 [Besnoitia besnoiti]|uniref:Uncharacterized protein n=1 Tax=Besnoitia besnoiti TaxID=94643 RepID=A0A2A9M7Q1_BESBE|nr:hypothetical protein BESB_024180 [Besnoitia besnoiti]PFH31926.1 hypothetical protein BESB_024180 [Besnoitia besnoiti]